MIEVINICHIFDYEKYAYICFIEFLNENRDLIKKIDHVKKTVEMKNGEVHYYMGEERYLQWCKGRDYVYDGYIMHSGYIVGEVQND